MEYKKLVHASSIATSVVIAVVVVATIVGEESPAFKGWLKSLTGHHWVTKSIGSLLIYAVLLPVCYRIKQEIGTKDVQKSLTLLFATVVLGALVIMGYYTWHFISA